MAHNDEEIDLNDEDLGSSVPSNSAPVEVRQTAAQKLAALRQKAAESRKANHAEAKEEQKRLHETPQEEAKRKKREYQEKQLELAKEAIARGEDPEKSKLLHTSAADIKQKKEKKEHFAWDMYNDDAQHKLYEKRIKEAGLTSGAAKEEYEKAKATARTDEFYRDANHLIVGEAPKVSTKKLDDYIDSLANQAKKRKEFSRRRADFEEEDVLHVGERNKKFNKKLERFYGQYTADIKSNVERGSAL